jgi:hypothetical protein
MELIYDHTPKTRVYSCPECGSSLNIPATAWDVGKSKRPPKHK